MQPVLIIGSSGAGKTALSRELGPALGLPVIHLDARYWKPGWERPDGQDWCDAVARMIGEAHWPPKILAMLERHAGSKTIVVLRSRRDVRRFVDEVRRGVHRHRPG